MLISDLIAHLNRTIDKEGDLEIKYKDIIDGQILPFTKNDIQIVEVADDFLYYKNTYLKEAFRGKKDPENVRKAILINQ